MGLGLGDCGTGGVQNGATTRIARSRNNCDAKLTMFSRFLETNLAML